MKQLKSFLLVLAAVVMCVSFSSCLNGDDSTVVSNTMVLKVKDNFLTPVFVSSDGYTINVKNTLSDFLSLSSGDFVYVAYTYDSSVDLNDVTKTIDVTVEAFEKISGNEVNGIALENDENYVSNRPVLDIKYGIQPPTMFDRNNLIVPISYYATKDLSKHKFSLVYYTDHLKGKDDNHDGLTLYLRHNSEEENESIAALSMRAFDLSTVINEYSMKYSDKPTKIYIEYEQNTTAGGDVPQNTTSLSIAYTYE